MVTFRIVGTVGAYQLLNEKGKVVAEDKDPRKLSRLGLFFYEAEVRHDYDCIAFEQAERNGSSGTR